MENQANLNYPVLMIIESKTNGALMAERCTVSNKS